MLALLSLAGPGIPVWAEFGGGISAGDIAKEFLFGVIVGVGTGGGLDDEFALNLEEDVVGCEWPLRFCGGCGGGFVRRRWFRCSRR